MTSIQFAEAPAIAARDDDFRRGIFGPLGIEHLESDLCRVEDALHEAVQTDDHFLTQLASHLTNAGGKRIRPALVLSAAHGSDGPGGPPVCDDVITSAVVVELVHLASLYHDDVMDESDTRRDVVSVNARWSNCAAILAGDFLMARAAALAVSVGQRQADLVAQTLAALCRGQLLEFQHLYNADQDTGSYIKAIAGKTAALIACSCQIGAMSAGLDQEKIDVLATFGHDVGMAFQIIDDVLDLTADGELLGKRVCSDLMEGIYTFPVLVAMQRSPSLKRMLGGPLGPDSAAVAQSIVLEQGGIDAALELADRYVQSVIDMLDSQAELHPKMVEGLRDLATDLRARRF